MSDRVLIGTAADAAAAIGLDMAEVWEAVAKGWLQAVCPECGVDVTGPPSPFSVDPDPDHAEDCSCPPWAIYHPADPE